MVKYQIEYSASLGTYFVRQALGPWPLKNWSRSPVFSSASRSECERWVDSALHRASPAGIAERKKADAQRMSLAARHQAMLMQGWAYDAPLHFYWRPDDPTMFVDGGRI